LAIFPKAEVQFMCRKRDDNELSRPKLNEKADKVDIKSEANIINMPSGETDVSPE
jgi:hypothetical protein|tara:strand:- start:442 stop:606 length:165 start_codon:yes stop_codon:yes gene_type:complete